MAAKTMKISSEKEKRCQLANELIEMIGNCGRKFFNYEDSTNWKNEKGIMSHFKLKNNRLYFVDGYIQRDIYAYSYRHFGRKFTQGGTMQALILDLSEFIRSGEATNAKNGYGGVYCDHWGYPEEDMIKIRNKAVEIGFSLSPQEDMDRHDYY